jgi:hypothetical protein
VKSYYAPVDHLMLLDQLAISIAGAEAGDPSLPSAFLICCSCRRRMPAPSSGDGARHWAALPTRSRDSGGAGGTVTIALSSSSVIAANSEGGVL